MIYFRGRYDNDRKINLHFNIPPLLLRLKAEVYSIREEEWFSYLLHRMLDSFLQIKNKHNVSLGLRPLIANKTAFNLIFFHIHGKLSVKQCYT